MKLTTLVLAIFPLMFTSAFAGEKVRPTKCLYTQRNYDGKNFNGQQRFEWCSEMNPNNNKKTGGVCIFVGGKTDKSGTWNRGTWDPSKQGAKRFIFSRNCDQGVEFIKIQEDALAQGPRLFDTLINGSQVSDVSAKKNQPTSAVVQNDPKFQNKMPAICFLQQDPTSLASSNGQPCSGDVQANGFCELKDLGDNPGFAANNRRWHGNWWVQYTDVNKRAFRVCTGGVTLVTTGPEDRIYENINNVAPLEKSNEAKFCTRNLKEIMCQPGDVLNSCFLNASQSAMNTWKSEVSNYIADKYPADKDKYKRKSPFGSGEYTYAKLRGWEPETEADKTFLQTANEKLNKAKTWYQNTKWIKDKDYEAGGYFESENCAKVIISKPSNS